jgi:4-amino-4-deoxy-L-arabinose transferase-like glycosyltransferase
MRLASAGPILHRAHRHSEVKSRGAALLSIVALAAVLRLWAIGNVPGNTFYDAAVRSMGHSWHDFFFGALEPGGSLAIDKPPLDLWLQVASTQILGFNRSALHLPEALAGVASSILLFGALRRPFGATAALLSALAMAVLPISVLTARSDTMDSVLAALCVAALWCSWLALESRRVRWMLLAALIMGVAFNVKLTEALLPLPALALLWWWASPRAPRARALTLAATGAVLIAVSLSWAALASLTPLSHRPFPVGSRTGSIWRLMFLYNGLERLGSNRPPGPVSRSGNAPGPLRLLDTGISQSAARIGLAALAAILLAGLAAALAARRRQPGAALSPAARLTVAIGVWLGCGLVLFSAQPRLQARYLEILAPAVSAILGISIASLVARRRIALTLATCVVTLALLGVELTTDVDLIRANSSDSVLSDPISAAMGRYLRIHRGGARYEVASAAVFEVTGLVARDGLPVLMINDADGSIVRSKTLRALVQSRQVRFYFASHGCHSGLHCPANERWAYYHSTPVHDYPGLRRFEILNSG